MFGSGGRGKDVNRKTTSETVWWRAYAHRIWGDSDLGPRTSSIPHQLSGLTYTWKGIYYQDSLSGFE